MNDGPDLSALGDLSEFQVKATDEQLKGVRELGQKLLTKTQEKDDLEKQLKTLNEELQDLQMKELPAAMEAIGLTEIGVGNQRLLVEPYFYANIGAKWEEPKREAAFDYLESVGGADLIRVDVTIPFTKKELGKARELCKKLQELGYDPMVSKGIPWASLTAWVREKVTGGKSLDLQILGATVGRKAKIEKRKKED